MRNRSPDEIRETLAVSYMELDLPPTASFEEVQKKYNQLIAELQPSNRRVTANESSEARIIEKFNAIKLAYEYIKKHVNKKSELAFENINKVTDKESVTKVNDPILDKIAYYKKKYQPLAENNSVYKKNLYLLKKLEKIRTENFQSIEKKLRSLSVIDITQYGIRIKQIYNEMKEDYTKLKQENEVKKDELHEKNTLKRSNEFREIPIKEVENENNTVALVKHKEDHVVIEENTQQKNIEKNDIVIENQKEEKEEKDGNEETVKVTQENIQEIQVIDKTINTESTEETNLHPEEKLDHEVVERGQLQTVEIKIEKETEQSLQIKSVTETLKETESKNEIENKLCILEEETLRNLENLFSDKKNNSSRSDNSEKELYSANNEIKTALQEFLQNEITAIQSRMLVDKNSYFGFNLLGWFYEQKQYDVKMDPGQLVNVDQQHKITKLQIVLDWLRNEPFLSNDNLKNIKDIIHSICAIKRISYLVEPKSQKNFENNFNITYTPILTQADLEELHGESDMEMLFQKLAEKSEKQQMALK